MTNDQELAAYRKSNIGLVTVENREPFNIIWATPPAWRLLGLPVPHGQENPGEHAMAEIIHESNLPDLQDFLKGSNKKVYCCLRENPRICLGFTRIPPDPEQLPIQNHDSGEVMTLTVVDASNLMKVQRELEEKTQELNRTSQLLDTTAEMAKVGAWEYQVKNRLLSWSPTTRTIYQVDDTFPVTVESALQFYPRERDRKHLVQLFQRCISHQEPFEEQVQIRTYRNNLIWVRYTGKPEIEKNTCVRIFGTFQDITQHKKIEALLRKEMDGLEKANQIKNQFLASMSHEIRTPINAIIGLSQFGLTNAPTLEFREHSKKINESSLQLLELVNSILDFSKMEYQRLELFKSPIDLQNFISTLESRFQPLAVKKNLLFQIHKGDQIPDSIVGDPDRIGQIIVNLVDNALKFTETGSVALEFDVHEATDEPLNLLVGVRDTGIGMDLSLQTGLFTAFTQGDSSSTRRHGGTGLGLSISKRLANLMGGTISVESTPGTGSYFLLTIPIELPDLLKDLPHLTGRITSYALLIGSPQNLPTLQSRMNVITRGSSLTILQDTDQEHLIDFIFLDCAIAQDPAQWNTTLYPGKPIVLLSLNGPEQEETEQHPVSQLLSAGDHEDLPPMLKHAPVFYTHSHSGSLMNALIRAYSQLETGKAYDSNDLRGKSVLLMYKNPGVREQIQEWLESHGMEVASLSGEMGNVQGCKDDGEFTAIILDLDMVEQSGSLPPLLSSLVPDCTTLPIIGLASNTADQDKALKLKLDACLDKPVDLPILMRMLTRIINYSQFSNQIPHSGSVPSHPEKHLGQDGGLNYQQGIDRMAGDQELYHELLKKFHDDAPAIISRLEAYFTMDQPWSKEQREQAAFLVHQIKGTAANLEAVEVAQACLDCETDIKQGSQDSVRCKILIESINRLLRTIRNLPAHKISQEQETQESQFRKQEILENLKEISQGIDGRLIIDTALISRTQQLFQGHPQATTLFEILRQKLWSLEYNGAAELIEQLTQLVHQW